MKTRYKNVTVAPDRHGKLRARFRKTGFAPVYMKTLPDQPGFEAEYKALLAGAPTQMETRHAPGSVHDLCTRYYRSADFAAKGTPETRVRRRWLIESFREEFGNDRVTDFRFEHIEAILMTRTEKKKLENGRTIGGQVAAVKLRKELLRLFAYAKKLEWISSNPVADAEKVGKERLQGFYTWTEEDIATYQAKHKLGTKARLALEIILWTGQRRGDARMFGPKHIVNGRINYQAAKTGGEIWMPVASDLRRAIDAMPSVGIATYLVTEFGKPYTKDGFGNKMREWCDEAGLPKCTAHGLRKAIARRMAESRLTDEQIMSVGGWKSSSQVRTYTEAANQQALAEGAIHQIDGLYSVKE
ncbi:integrase [Sphingomonas sp. ABOLD]|uniref:Integrase n=1 Tax=Sphingomonas trueperi TaxID=53317 RepID=A0A7X5Y4N4_9SPHN|nr:MULTISPECIES: site-specific integrase [Sphingomonas]NJB99396.1 integrase [Sphingomonas trueperi]RSV34848.1 integrase [Sphingomonas sp. ABOLE]RSV40942.1 integrase [Sphingomonas sp. ABOLD]